VVNMAEFKLNLFTPKSVVIKARGVDKVVVPTIKGTIQILPGHLHIVEKLSPGILTVQGEHGEEQYFISDGIVKLFGGTISVLAQECCAPNQVNKELAKTTYESLMEKTKLTEGLKDYEIDALYEELDNQRAKMEFKA